MTDDFGRFNLRPGVCIRCGAPSEFTIKYVPKNFKLPNEIDVKRTILKSSDNRIGIGCGCYAKFHRQIAHIVDRQTLKDL